MPTKTLLSATAYLEREAQAEHKSEYYEGEIVSMAGASLAHNRIIWNLNRLLISCIDAAGCEMYSSDALLKLVDCDRYVYPDLMIFCDEPALDTEKQRGLDVLLNPTVIIEVMSPSTAERDRGEKMKCYFQISSLQQYLLLDSEKVEAISYDKNQAGEWVVHYANLLEEAVKVKGCELSLEELYLKVNFS
ncbi:MAG: Uma2 family endonuclease [Bernardetiaceae bacterium]|nr:Uma2 family endonuclease [Bernardetiaceae bacterium]